MPIPPDFGGFVGVWAEGRAIVLRYGRGKPVGEGLSMTPLNLLQLRKLLDDLIAQGDASGKITEEHRRQANLLPSSQGIEQIIPREQVDRIAGSD